MPGIRDLNGKTVVVTGGGSGIGRAMALAFAAEGANLVLADLREQRLSEVAAEIRPLGVGCTTHTVDVAQRSEVEAFAQAAIDEHGDIDILCNNAGVAVGASLDDTSIEDFEWLFGINFWGVLYGIKAFLPHMLARGSGHIVNTASVAGLCAGPGLTAYCASKFAVVGLGESLRAELKGHDIGVTSICPGIINTRIVDDARIHIKPGAAANPENLTRFYRRRGWSPDRVARAAVKAVRKNRSVVPVAPEAWLMWLIKRFSQRGHDYSAYLLGRRLMEP